METNAIGRYSPHFANTTDLDEKQVVTNDRAANRNQRPLAPVIPPPTSNAFEKQSPILRRLMGYVKKEQMDIGVDEHGNTTITLVHGGYAQLLSDLMSYGDETKAVGRIFCAFPADARLALVRSRDARSQLKIAFELTPVADQARVATIFQGMTRNALRAQPLDPDLLSAILDACPRWSRRILLAEFNALENKAHLMQLLGANSKLVLKLANTVTDAFKFQWKEEDAVLTALNVVWNEDVASGVQKLLPEKYEIRLLRKLRLYEMSRDGKFQYEKAKADLRQCMNIVLGSSTSEKLTQTFEESKRLIPTLAPAESAEDVFFFVALEAFHTASSYMDPSMRPRLFELLRKHCPDKFKHQGAGGQIEFNPAHLLGLISKGLVGDDGRWQVECLAMRLIFDNATRGGSPIVSKPEAKNNFRKLEEMLRVASQAGLSEKTLEKMGASLGDYLLENHAYVAQFCKYFATAPHNAASRALTTAVMKHLNEKLDTQSQAPAALRGIVDGLCSTDAIDTGQIRGIGKAVPELLTWLIDGQTAGTILSDFSGKRKAQNNAFIFMAGVLGAAGSAKPVNDDTLAKHLKTLTDVLARYQAKADPKNKLQVNLV